MLDILTAILQSEAFGTFVTNLLLMLVTVLVPLIGAAIRNFIVSRKDDTRFQTLLTIAKTAVLAAEQMGLSGAIEDKKGAAIQMAQSMLGDRGIKVDVAALEAAIEAAVADELNRPAINDANYAKTTAGAA